MYGHFGTKTLRHRCRSVSDISAPITEVVMLVNGGSYVVDGEGSLKQLDVYVPLSMNCGF